VTRDQFRSALAARPFVPFLLHLPDGRSIRIGHPETVAVSPDGRAALLWDERGSFHVVDLMLVPDVEFLRPRGSRRSA
jgi:hypothetical protein